MSIYEERLTTLEQKVEKLQQNTSRSIQEVDENTTILLGVIRHQGQDIRRISEVLETMNTRLTTLETTFNEHTTLLNEHTKLLTQILERLPQNP